MRFGKFARMAIGVLACVILLELGARQVLGLGDPPLYDIDPEIEYIYKPNKTYHRFGNLISYNEVSMRAAHVPDRANRNIERLLVMGDSVVNGGAIIDQSQLASERLSKRIGTPNWVGNISAGSWGPANLLAYVKRFGWFDADIAILVISTHDLTDLPTYQKSYGINHPTTAPLSALVEGFTRYGSRYIPGLKELAGPAKAKPPTIGTNEKTMRAGRKALQELLAAMKNNVKRTIIIVHPTTVELGRPLSAKRQNLLAVVAGANVEYLDLLKVGSWTKSLYLDNIHLNAKGQEKLSEIMLMKLGAVSASY